MLLVKTTSEVTGRTGDAPGAGQAQVVVGDGFHGPGSTLTVRYMGTGQLAVGSYCYVARVGDAFHVVSVVVG